MKLTPLDIRKQEFSRRVRGIDAEEVRAFLQMIASQWEEIQDEQRRLEEKVRELNSKLEHYSRVEEALQEALRTARDNARTLIDTARRKSQVILDEAEARAADIKRDADEDRRSMKRQAVRLSHRRDEIVSRLRAFLLSEMEMLARYEGDDAVGFIRLLPAEEKFLKEAQARRASAEESVSEPEDVDLQQEDEVFTPEGPEEAPEEEEEEEQPSPLPKWASFEGMQETERFPEEAPSGYDPLDPFARPTPGEEAPHDRPAKEPEPAAVEPSTDEGAAARHPTGPEEEAEDESGPAPYHEQQATVEAQQEPQPEREPEPEPPSRVEAEPLQEPEAETEQPVEAEPQEQLDPQQPWTAPEEPESEHEPAPDSEHEAAPESEPEIHQQPDAEPEPRWTAHRIFSAFRGSTSEGEPESTPPAADGPETSEEPPSDAGNQGEEEEEEDLTISSEEVERIRRILKGLD